MRILVSCAPVHNPVGSCNTIITADIAGEKKHSVSAVL